MVSCLMTYPIHTTNQMETQNDASLVSVEVLEDEITTKQGAERYGCENYSTFHNRMVKLGIKPERRGRSSFLNSSQIKILDECDMHLRGGGIFSDFIKSGETSPNKTQSIPSKKESSNSSIVSIGDNSGLEQQSIIIALQTLANANYDVLTPQKRLQEAVENNYLLTTEQVSKILGFSSSTISSWKTNTIKLGFTFTKEKEGNSVVWRINR